MQRLATHLPTTSVLTLLAALGPMATATPAGADTLIDDFNTGSMSISAPPASSTAFSDPSILGGQRDLAISWANGPGTGFAQVNVGASGLATLAVPTTTPGTNINATIIWDGVDAAGSADADGLGGIDLTEGGTVNAFRVRFLSASSDNDFANFRVLIYSGLLGHGLDIRVPVTLPITEPTDVYFPFADAIVTGSGGDYTDVGIIYFGTYSAGSGLDWEVDFIDTVRIAGTLLVDAAAPPGGNGLPGSPFDTIQGAIDAAVSGLDTILVAPGTYAETLDLLGKEIVLTSSGGAAVTTIDGGGAAHVVTCATGETPATIIEGFTITGGNAATPPDDGGAGLYIVGAEPTVRDCVFTGNDAANSGGGLYVENGAPEVSGCTFIGNTAGIVGGGLYLLDADAYVEGCRFLDNEANVGGGCHAAVTSAPLLVNCLFTGNSALDQGGGIGGGATTAATLVNCTFTGNTAASLGGAMRISSTNAWTVRNCILWGDAPDEIRDQTGLIDVATTIVEGGWTGTGIIDADPVFVDADGLDDAFGTPDDNAHLATGSAALDAGDNGAVPLGVDTDLDGFDRFRDDANVADTGSGTAPIVDLGALERQYDSGPVLMVSPGGSIAAAMASASDGDEIVLAAGTYTEAIHFNGRALTLRGADPSDPDVVAATILSGLGLGGSIVTFDSGEGAGSVLAGLTLEDGDTPDGGGAVRIVGASPTIEDCRFVDNSAALAGGAIAIDGGAAAIRRCEFRTCESSGGGGAIAVNDATPTIDACWFLSNDTNNVGDGGALLVTGTTAAPVLTNALIHNNNAARGGGVAVLADATATVASCTLSGNYAPTGRCLYKTGPGTLTVTNSIVRDYSVTPIGGDGTIDVTYSNVGCDTNSCAVAGTGNIDAVAAFLSTSFTDPTQWSLRPYSPGIDAGDPSLVPASGAMADFAGAARVTDDPGIVDTGAGAIDMGAFERTRSSAPETLDVPGTYATLAEAVEAGEDHDVIQLAPGTYPGPIDTNKALSLLGDPSDPASTVIEVPSPASDPALDVQLSGALPVHPLQVRGITFSGGTRGMTLSAYAFSTLVEDCVFELGEVWGAINASSSADLTLRRCALRGNTATNSSTLTLNSSGGTVLVDACTIADNVATGISTTTGKAVYFGSGAAAITVVNTLVADNDCANGVLYNHPSGATRLVADGTIANNLAGAGEDTVQGPIDLVNCVAWGNSSGIEAGLDVTWSIVEGGYPGTGNLDVDPLFVDDGAGDYRLDVGSPAIDAGDDASVPAGITEDLEGNPRVTTGVLGGMPTVDLGAYEYPADCDDSGTNDNDEYLAGDLTDFDGNGFPDVCQGGAVYNATADTLHPTIADALALAAPSDALVTAPSTFTGEPAIDLGVPGVSLESTGAIDQPIGGLYELGDGVRLATASGATLVIANELRGGTGDLADVFAGALETTPGSLLAVLTGGGLFIETELGATLDGTTRVDPAGTLHVLGDVEAAGTLSLLPGAVCIVEGGFAPAGPSTSLDGDLVVFGDLLHAGDATWFGIDVVADALVNDPAGTIVGFGNLFADVDNDGAITTVGDSTIVGDFVNDGVTTVQVGTLTVIGAVTNNGTIVGDVVDAATAPDGTRGAAPTPVALGDPGADGGPAALADGGMAILGDYHAGAAASLLLAEDVWTLSVTGDFDVAIDDPMRFDLSGATWRLSGGPGAPGQTVEQLSTDDGPGGDGAGFAIHRMVVTAGSTVALGDVHDNDGAGQAVREATYVDELVVETGATLTTNGGIVYVGSAVIDGIVDDPGDIVPRTDCPADTDGSGTVDVTDLVNVVLDWGTDGSGHGGDIDGSGVVDVTDLVAIILAWGAC